MDCNVGGVSPSHGVTREAILWLQGEKESGEEIRVGYGVLRGVWGEDDGL